MSKDAIDYEALKDRGFLTNKQDGYFALRTRMPVGNYAAKHLKKLSEIAEQYGKGFVHLTVRQGAEIPFIRYEDIDAVEEEINSVGILPGACGARLRATTTCPGSSWCKRALVDTARLYERIEKEKGVVCGMHLPHKFKIAISGCPNTCTRAQMAEIGVHGAIDVTRSDKRAGYAVFLGGCGGKKPQVGLKLDKVFSEEELLELIGRVVDFYKNNAKSRQRLASLIEEMGENEFLKAVGGKI